MSADNVVKLSAVSDAAVIELMADLMVTLKSSGPINVQVPTRQLGDFTGLEGMQKAFPDIEWTSSRLVTSASLPLVGGRMSLHFQRTGALESKLTLNANSSSMPDLAQYLKTFDHIRRFGEQSLAGIVGFDAPNGFKEAAAQQLTQLTELHTRILHDAERNRLAGEKRIEDAKAELEKSFAERKAQLESQADEQSRRLRQAEDELGIRQKALDDRGHMHARRELRSQITEALKERLARPTISKHALSARTSITFFSALGILALGTYAAFAAFDMHTLLATQQTSEIPLIVAALRFSLPVAAAVGLLFYLLNWWRRVHSEDIRAERDLERYRYDIDRASWVVETILEARAKEAGEVPKEWVQGATHGMFSRSDANDEDQGALEALAALLGLSARVEVGTDGGKVELKRDGLKRIAKSANGE